MVTDGVAEMLVGVTVDPQFGQLLTLGAGGVLTELLRDSVSLLPPFSAASVGAAIGKLRVARLLAGYRGRPPGDVAALIETALACTRYAAANLERLVELDLNPVIVRPAGRGAVAVDALIRLERSEEHTSELQSPCNLVCRLLLEKKKKIGLRTTAGRQHHR